MNSKKSYNESVTSYNRNIQRELHNRLSRGEEVFFRSNTLKPFAINRYSEPKFAADGVYVSTGSTGKKRIFVSNDDIARALSRPTALQNYLEQR